MSSSSHVRGSKSESEAIVRRVVGDVCRLPANYRSDTSWPGVSKAELLRRSGYATRRAVIGEEDFEAFLKQEPSLINDWVGLSQDQRCTPALCLLRPDESKSGRWAVARIPGELQLEFDSEYEAAAHYIKRYVDEIIRDDTLLNSIKARFWIWWNLRT